MEFTVHAIAPNSRKLRAILLKEATADRAILMASEMARTSSATGTRYVACRRDSLTHFVRIAEFRCKGR